MAQWFAAKAEYPDALVFFRMGDFYELFFDDAMQAAAALDIQLTQRGSYNGSPINMCGVPVHAAEAYLARLIRRGFRVAIAEQMEDPKARVAGAKGPLKREVVRLVTPGTLTEDTLLDPSRANLLLVLIPAGDMVGAAWIDISAARFETEEIVLAELPALLGRLEPSEILAPASLQLGDWRKLRPPVEPQEDSAETRRLIAADSTLSQPEAAAAAAALAYVKLTQAGALPLLPPPLRCGAGGLLQMDAATRASLEIAGKPNGGIAHSLLGCIRRTLTAAGARLLAERIAAPLTDIAQIVARQDAWAWLLARPAVLDASRDVLRQAPDMARALGRLSLGRFAPRDLAVLRDGHAACGNAAAVLRSAHDLPPALQDICQDLDLKLPLLETLRFALADKLPARTEDGGIIVTGFDGELDALRSLRDDRRSALATLQLDLAQRYGVAALRIRHHQQLGYQIEVPAAAVEKLRTLPELILRQSMANCARFSTSELARLDERINEAGSEAAARERVIVQHLVQQSLAQAVPLAAAAAALAALDVAQSAAKLAGNDRWSRPAISEDTAFQIQAGRHPVVESALAGLERTGTANFISNDTDLSPARRLLLLTGPNMAGKSTYLRQNALIVLLAQAGLPVPALHARIGIVDRLFCRLGAADDLAAGRSTFMVEMVEAATILHQATYRSLVVIDEIGRGTATLDGLAIAWAVLEALHNQTRARTIFATHFHELARLHHELPHLCPHTMRVKEWRGDVVFLHEVAEGAGGRSWGVQVAKLAGVPLSVVRRAGAILAALEVRGADLTQDVELPLFADTQDQANHLSSAHPVLQAVAEIDPDTLTPREALDALYRLKGVAAKPGAVSR